MQCRFTTYKEYFCTLILPKNEERHFCSGLLAVLCVTANVLWLHFWLLFSTVQYFPNLHFSSRMAEEAPYEQGILFICTRAALWDPRNMNGLPWMPEKCWTGSPTCRIPDTRHYFGTSGAAKWRGNLRLATSKPVKGHTSKIFRRRGISCVLQEALRIPNPAALQQPASQGMFLATRRHHIWGAWWSSSVGQAAAWSPKSLGFAAEPKLLLCDQYLKATFSPLSLLSQQNQGVGCLLRCHLGSAFHYPAESCNNAPLQRIY